MVAEAQRYEYNLPKCGHPEFWNAKQCRAPRWYWFQLILPDGEEKRFRKEFTWAGACEWGNAIYQKYAAEVMFLIDGRVPESELEPPPTKAVWNRWEREPFVENGKPCVLIEVKAGGSVERLYTPRTVKKGQKFKHYKKDTVYTVVHLFTPVFEEGQHVIKEGEQIALHPDGNRYHLCCCDIYRGNEVVLYTDGQSDFARSFRDFTESIEVGGQKLNRFEEV